MLKITRLVILILVLVQGNLVFSQRKTFFGFEGAVANDLYKIEDSSNGLVSARLITGLWGINVRQELNNKVFLEMGVFSKMYWDAVAFNPYLYGASTSFNALLIPARFVYSIKLSKKISFLLMPAVTLGINLDAYLASGRGWGTTTLNGFVIEYHYEENEDVSRCFLLLSPGLGIERKFFNTVLLSLYAVRNFGFTKVKQLDIHYTIDGSAPVSAKEISYGEYWSVGLSLKYPISNIWQK